MKLLLKILSCLIIVLSAYLVRLEQDSIQTVEFHKTIVDNSEQSRENRSEIPPNLPEEKREKEEKIEDSVERIERDTQTEFFTFIQRIFFPQIQIQEPLLTQYFSPNGFTLVHSAFAHIWVCCFRN